MLKAYKYRIFPTKDQKQILARTFGSCRFVYNNALTYKISQYKNHNRNLSCYDLSNEFLTPLKHEYEWLREVPSQALQQSLRHIGSAFKNFFKKTGGYPKFKSRHSRQSFALPQSVKVDFKTNNINIPKLGKVLGCLHRTFKGKVKTCTVSKNNIEQYFISILVEDGNEEPIPVISEPCIGIDLGIKDFAIFSNKEKIANPAFYHKKLKKIQNLQQKLSTKAKGSKNFIKTKFCLNKVYQKVTNQRDDFLHQKSSSIINENQVIVLEDLDIKQLLSKAPNHALARNISDVSWGKFVEMLKYKAKWRGKKLVQIGRFEPTSKKCSKCGYIKKDLKLTDREWECTTCGTFHDRDINAAINILEVGKGLPELSSLRDKSYALR